MSLQTFTWDEDGTHDPLAQRTYYQGFTLKDTHYQLGDAVYLFPESDDMPLHLGRIQTAFVDTSPTAADTHCIEIRWFERFSNLEPSATEAMHELEVVELEDADVNPMGCLAGKANVLRVNSYEQAEQLFQRGIEGEWFYCRGLFKQSTGEFVLYDAAAVALPPASHTRRLGSCSDAGDSANALTQDTESCKKKLKTQHNPGAAPAAPLAFQKTAIPRSPGKVCVECGATQTPQWREGPAGPKTLCNACGVRYNRLRASKKNGSIGSRQPKGKAPKQFQKEAPHKEAPQYSRALPPPATQLRKHQQQQQLSQQQQQWQPHGPGGSDELQQALLAVRRGSLSPGDTEDLVLTALPGTTTALSTGGSSNGVPLHDDSLHSSESAEDRVFVPNASLLVSALDAPMQALQGAELQAGAASCRPSLLQLDAAVGAGPSARLPARTFSGSASLAEMPGQAAPHVALTLLSDHAAALEQHENEQDIVLLPDLGPTDLGCTALPAAPVPTPARAAEAAAAATAAPAPASCSAGNVLRGVALRVVHLCPDIAGEFGEVLSNFEALQGRLPPDLVGQLLSITEQVDAAASEASSAEVALQAVMQIASVRQKAADSSREKAAACVDRLKACMTDLLQQYSGDPQYGDGHAPPGALQHPEPGAQLFAPQPGTSGGAATSKGMLESRSSWGPLDHEHDSLLGDPGIGSLMLEGNLFDGAAVDSGAALLGVDCGYGSSLIRVRN